ncbi:hypothetical protein ZHAS_00016409 [Anopheles sinensis]|uniref:Uncharacterized protein n=1 Tax=Anopheles sinensis TaxID=74873 RepID=A0A084WDI8_ANOSI|nr:hypothetical protein ZHAS_00016409 [Anopheles sinensis]
MESCDGQNHQTMCRQSVRLNLLTSTLIGSLQLEAKIVTISRENSRDSSYPDSGCWGPVQSVNNTTFFQ